jgi:hypothetical protein
MSSFFGLAALLRNLPKTLREVPYPIHHDEGDGNTWQ